MWPKILISPPHTHAPKKTQIKFIYFFLIPGTIYNRINWWAPVCESVCVRVLNRPSLQSSVIAPGSCPNEMIQLFRCLLIRLPQGALYVHISPPPCLLYSGQHKELPLNNKHVTHTCSLHFSRHVGSPGTPRDLTVTPAWGHVTTALPAQWPEAALCVCCSNYCDGPIRNNCASGDPVCPYTGLCAAGPLSHRSTRARLAFKTRQLQTGDR